MLVPVPSRSVSRRGFTLIEATLAMTIVGSAILGVIALFAACTKENAIAANMTTAMFLANNMQEAMTGLPFSDPSGAGAGLEEAGQPVAVWNDIDDFNDYTANPPLDATRQPINELANYSQAVTVTPVDPSSLGTTAAGAAAARITVRVLYQPPGKPTASEVHRISWVRFRS